MNSQSKPLRWGVVGCGQIAIDKSLPGLLHARNAQLVALCDPLLPRRTLAIELARQHDVQPRIYKDYSELLADPDVDAVYISLPTGMHPDAVVAAAKAKKAILCEKPLGRNAGEVRVMVRAAQENGVPLMTAYMSRFGEVFQEAVRLLREKTIGQITFVNAHFSYPCLRSYPPGAPGDWRWTDGEGGGPLLDIGVYLAFGLREMLGERIVQVAPINLDTIAPPEARVKDTTAAWFVTESGIPGTFVSTFSHFNIQLEFYGTAGRLSVRGLFSQSPGGRLECQTEAGTHVLDTTQDEDLPHFENYRREFEHFSNALVNNTPFRPASEEVLADALLLEALRGNVQGIAVPSPAQFLETS